MRAENNELRKLNVKSLLLFLLLLSLPATSRAQVTEARISVVSLSPPRVRVEGRLNTETTTWSFRNAYAGLLGLGERIERLSLADTQGADVPVRRLASGEYSAKHPAVAFRYEVSLDPPPIGAAAHVSWLDEAHGILMPGDLLPLPLARAKLSLTLPAEWRAVAVEEEVAAGLLDLDDAESSVLFIGRDVRLRHTSVQGMGVKLAVSGNWAFSDQEALETVVPILKEHAKTFGCAARERALVIIAPPPYPINAAQWSAETRGGTVLFLSGRSPSKVSALARLSVPLVHELFHLWVPNGLPLTGDYAWFYEGFTNYQALRVSQRLGFINFNDYLDALARAYDGYLFAREREPTSLLDASSRRWTGSNALVYHKGMVVAALYDLSLRSTSGGRRSLEDVYRELFRVARATTQGRDANAVALEVLERAAAGASFTLRLIKSTQPLDLGSELQRFGLEVSSAGGRTRITVARPLSGSQRDLLRQIGYNN